MSDKQDGIKRKCRHCKREWECPRSELFLDANRYCCGDYPESPNTEEIRRLYRVESQSGEPV